MTASPTPFAEGAVSPPNGYHPLPAGFACKCVQVWQDGKGNYWCCRPVAVEMPGSEPGKATGSKMELVQPASADDPGRALWDKMQAEHDEQLSKHSMFQASAAMPSEETVRAFNLAGRAMQRRFAASGSEEEIEAALSEFFAPILAEKERVEREWTSEKERADMAAAQMVKQNDRVRELVALLDKQMGTPCEQIRHRQQIYEERETNALALSCWQDAARALEAERDALEARALAAEAALAAERERCAKVAEGHEGLHCGSLLEGPRAQDYDCGQIDASTSIAAAIRAQGE